MVRIFTLLLNVTRDITNIIYLQYIMTSNHIKCIVFLGIILFIALAFPIYKEPFRRNRRQKKRQTIIEKVGEIAVSDNNNGKKMQMLNQIIEQPTLSTEYKQAKNMKV